MVGLVYTIHTAFQKLVFKCVLGAVFDYIILHVLKVNLLWEIFVCKLNLFKTIIAFLYR